MLCGPLDKTLVSVLVHDPPIGSILREDTAYHPRNMKSLLMVVDVALLKTIKLQFVTILHLLFFLTKKWVIRFETGAFGSITVLAP